jgi:hypothetical protein
MQPSALGGLDKGEIELQVMTYLFYVRTFGKLAQILERSLQLPEISHINPPRGKRELG